MEAMTVGGTSIPEHDAVVAPPKIAPNRLMESLGQEADRRALRTGSSKKEHQENVNFLYLS